MHPRIQEVLHCLDTEFAGLRAAVESIPPGRRAERPAADRWSVAEVLDHLARVERSVLKACVNQLAAARESGLPDESETTSIRETMPPERVANRDRPLVSPERLLPKGNDADAAWAEVEAVRERLREFTASCDGLALSQIGFPHPALGPLNMYQWLLFSAGHHARHAAQIREIADQLTPQAPAAPAASTPAASTP
jgi:uncharacterized damage-inducible protein DinB